MDPKEHQHLLTPMHYRQPPDFYPAGLPAGKVTSSAVPRSGDGTMQGHHPPITRQDTTQLHEMALAGIAERSYGFAPHHDLYTTPPEAHQSRHVHFDYGSSQSWHPHEYPMSTASGMPSSFDSFPSASPYPPPRLSPPPLNSHPHSATSRHGPLAGSLDPHTGIFYRTPDHPRLRTAQACEKCRTRKAKCSGEHPSCKRCISRGLTCEYAKEGRVRGPNKPKKPIGPGLIEHQPINSSRNRSSSTNTSSSTGSSEHLEGPTTIVPLRDTRPTSQQYSNFVGSQRPSQSFNVHRPSRPRLPHFEPETRLPYQMDTSRTTTAGLQSNPYMVSHSRGNSLNPGVPLISLPQEPAVFDAQGALSAPYHALYAESEGPMIPPSPSSSQVHSDYFLAQVQSPMPVDQPTRLRSSRSLASFSSQPHGVSQYEISQDASAISNYLDLHQGTHQSMPAVARYNLQAEYPLETDGPLYPFEASGSSSGSTTTPTPSLTPTWAELGGASGEISHPLDDSFSGPVIADSSATSTDRHLFTTSHAAGLLPEHTSQQHSHGSVTIQQQVQATQDMSH